MFSSISIGYIIAGVIVAGIIYSRYVATTPSPSSVSISPSGVVGCPEKNILKQRYNEEVMAPSVSAGPYPVWLKGQLPPLSPGILPGYPPKLSPSCPEHTVMKTGYDFVKHPPPALPDEYIIPAPMAAGFPDTYSEYVKMMQLSY